MLRWLPVCLHDVGSWSTDRGLSLPSQASALGWKALQRYTDSMPCLQTSFVLPKVACFDLTGLLDCLLTAHDPHDPRYRAGCPFIWDGASPERQRRERRWEWLKDELQGEILWAGLSLNSAWLLFA